MSNSHEQSLDEAAVFLPVNESSPEFLHSEKERQAVERLLNAGPEAFYSSIGTERSGCFLSSEEVSQITSWAQDFRLSPQPVHRQENGDDGGLEMEEFCSTYFPSFSDTPIPDLELGWPERGPWVPKESVTVYTNPPAEGQPHIRQIIRRQLQKAGQVIAIVTDRLTDGAIIGDLHNAASRGVPVYIILNQRSIQENFTLNRLRHPNMRVRVLGGKTFCSLTGRMVVGEMKDKFLLVDLETVIYGSYSFTWTDTHLHRQLITVTSGPVVESFDREFRILFAASLPVPDTWRAAGAHTEETRLKDRSDLRFQRHQHLEAEIIGPPSPPTDSLLDWEAMGVLQRDRSLPESPVDQHEEIMVQKIPLQSKMLFDQNIPYMDGFAHNGNQSADKKRVYENSSPVTNTVPDKHATLKNTQPPPTDPTSPERIKRGYENASPEIKTVADIFKTFNNKQPPTTDPAYPERMKRVYENTSPVTNTVPDKHTIYNNIKDPPTDPTPPERMKRLYENTSPVTNTVPDKSTFNNKQPLQTDLTSPESMKRVEHIINKTISRQLSLEKRTNSNDRKRLDDNATDPPHNVIVLSSSKRRERPQRVLEEESSINELSSKVENSPSSRKPIILRMPQSESFSSLSDIMKRIQPQSASAQLRTGSKGAVSEVSRSMMDLSVHNSDDDRGPPVPRFKASYFDPDHLTPALALMKKRNDELKPSLYRTPKNFLPRERPRSSSYALNLDWRRSLAEAEGELE